MQTQEINNNKEATKNEEENTQTENDKQMEEKKDGANYSINLAILGGVVGAGIGLLTNPETGKKVMKHLGQSEFVKVADREFRKTAQELLAGQAQNSIRQLAEGYISKIDGKLLSPKKENSNSSEKNQEKEGKSSKYEEIKEENKELNERLQKIETMLNDLAESK